MKIHNTLSKRLEELEPLVPGEVRMYTCGPTVYNYAHIGNYRAYIFEDLLRRHLKFRGFKVTQVMNLTDVDDKTIRGAIAAGTTLDAYTATYKQAFFDDLKTLNVEPAEHYPAATGHIPEMIALIGRLFDNGYAYRSDDGSVYFSIAKFKNYGRLAHLDMSGLKAGARVAQDEYEKENLADFALWKAWDEKDGAVVWDSPWGKGRPGWHIECSAMSMKLLGESFDLHTGGIDNVFPHHEDEIAQSEAATGKPFVKYWMHCAHLVVDGRKMAKSLGNFYTLRDIGTRGYSGREIRFVLISAHYRQSLNFTFDALDQARASLARLDDFKSRMLDKTRSDKPGAALPDWAERAKSAFIAALDNDLNISEALAAIFDMVYAGNKAVDAGDTAFSGKAVLDMLTDLDRVLGLLSKPEDGPDPELTALAAAREQARRDKNWAEADRIRKALADKGWEVRDTPEGPKLKKKT